MNVVCEKCKAIYELDPDQIQGASVRVKCSSCGYLFRVFKSKEQDLKSKATPEIVSEWIIRYADGASSQVPDLATLQKWVVEGKVSRLDELSQDGRNWRELGEVAELTPFFQLIDKLGTANPTATPPPTSSISLQPDEFDLSSMSPKSTMEFGYTEDLLPQHYETNKNARLQIGQPKAEDDPKTIKMSEPIMPIIQEETLEKERKSPFANIDSVSSLASIEETSPKSKNITDDFAAASLQNAHYEAQIETHDETNSPHSPNNNIPNVQVGVPTEVSLQGAEIKLKDPQENTLNNALLSNVQTQPLQDQEEKQIETQEDGQHYTSGEWFMGPSEVVEKADPQLSMAEEPELRDFSSYSESDLNQVSDHIDDLEFQPSNKGKIFLIIVLVLGLIVGGLYMIQPKLFTSISIALGLIEYHPDAKLKVAQARRLLHQFTFDAFAKSEKTLQEAVKIQGKPFLPQQALAGVIQLNRAEYYYQQIASWKNKFHTLKKEEKALLLEMKAIDPKDKEKTQKETIIRNKLKLLTKSLDNAESKYQEFHSNYEKYRNLGKNTLAKLQTKKKPNIYERLGLLHLTSFAIGARDSFEELLQKTKKEFKDQQWISELDRLEALFLFRQGRYERSLWFLIKLLKKRKDWMLLSYLQIKILSLQKKNKLALKKFARLSQETQQHPLIKKLKDDLLAQKNKVKPVVALAKKTATTKLVKVKKAKKARRRGVPRTFKALFRRAERLRRRERLRGALRYYYLARKKKKTSAVYSGLAWCLLDLGKVRKAKKYFKISIRMNKRNPDPYYGLGLVYRRMHKKSQAKNMLKSYLKRFPRGRDVAEIRSILRGL